jgi:hypothetical protein
MATKRVWTDNAKPYLNPYTSALLCPPSKIYMGVDVAPNPNHGISTYPRISM